MKHRLFLLSALLVLLASAQNTPQTWQRNWPFNGDLNGQGQYCPFFTADPRFVPIEGGRKALAVTENIIVTTNNDQLYKIEPGFKLACRVKFDRVSVSSGWGSIFRKGRDSEHGAYFLRLDQAPEKPAFSFFLNLDGAPEPRVSSPVPPEPNVWYDIEAGWDGTYAWLSVNGTVSRVRREGQAIDHFAPLTIGPFNGCICDVRADGHPTDNDVVGNWPFDGDLRDISKYGHHFAADQHPAKFVANTALSTAPLSTPSAPELQLVPGLKLRCAVNFSKLPLGETVIIEKRNSYLLRYDATSKGGYFGFWAYTNKNWEPRAAVSCKLELNKWYRITAGWDGFKSYLQVNGEANDTAHAGLPLSNDEPLQIGNFDGLLDDLVIENPRRPLITLSAIRTTQLYPRAGEPLTLQATLQNIGGPVDNCTVTLRLPKGLTCDRPVITLPRLEENQSVPLTWNLQSPDTFHGSVSFVLQANGKTLRNFSHRVTVAPPKDLDRSARLWNPVVKQTSCHYIDSRDGDDSRDGNTPATAWRTFKNINGKTLAPGERVLLKRGSVFNEELVLTAAADQDNWAEIAAYGEGHRPTIRRNRFINDRCAYIVDPKCLIVRDLIVCNAGKGLNFLYHYHSSKYHGLLVENCLAHHIEGLYRFNSHGIPEWRDQNGAPGGGRGGIGAEGSGCGIVFRDCEMYQCSSAFHATGDTSFYQRLFSHDNYAHNTSPHPFLSSSSRSVLCDSIFDASGWNASAGTMGIMLGPNYGLVIRNCHFLNQPDSGSHDEGGIDFECGGEANIVDRCTFRNNAGAAIEVLGLVSPQTKNVTISNCRFIQNNTATKLGPAEIFVWGGNRDRNITCSNGLIRNNGYVLLPKIQFYVNQFLVTDADWTLKDNTQYATPEEIDRAMPYNNPPMPAAGPEIWTDNPTVTLNGTATDDHRTPGPLLTAWEQLEGPAAVKFAKPDALSTTANFPAVGDYRLNLKADDGQLWRASRTAVHILPRGSRVTKAWTFSTNLDTEGWTHHDLGTAHEDIKAAKSLWNTFADPVHLVCNDFFVLAIKDAPDARLLSADNLNLDTRDCPALVIRIQNHTPAKQMKVSFTTTAAPDWDAARSVTFPVIPNDEDDTLYTVPLADCPAYTGTLKQLRLNFSADATPITGTCRLDYLWLGKAAR